MIKCELPVISQEIKDGKLITSRSTITCYLDLSIAAQETWERINPQLASKISLFDYVEQLQASPDSKAKSVSCLKAIYCFLVFEKPMSLIEFLRMFSITDEDYFKELVSKIEELFTTVLPELQKN